ncbi:hypothetical protein Tco_0435331 [Tanacetum coccineum]
MVTRRDPPPINTEATTITTSLPEITPFIALQLRVAKLEQEMSEVKKTDVLASIRSQVPTAVNNYLGTKLDDALLKPKRNMMRKTRFNLLIQSTDKVDLEEFDLKSALFSHMNKKKSANKNTTNYRLYHALMEALIADEDAMDKEVADQVKDHKRKHDKWMMMKDDQSKDERNDSDMEDTDNAHIPKVSTTTWFKPIPESERPATPEPEWTISPNDFPEPEHNWANAYATTYKVPEENKLQRKTYDIGSFIKWFCRRTGKKKLSKADLEGPTFNLVKSLSHEQCLSSDIIWMNAKQVAANKSIDNPEGVIKFLRNIYEPLPVEAHHQVSIQPQFFFNRDLDYLPDR